MLGLTRRKLAQTTRKGKAKIRVTNVSTWEILRVKQFQTLSSLQIAPNLQPNELPSPSKHVFHFACPSLTKMGEETEGRKIGKTGYFSNRDTGSADLSYGRFQPQDSKILEFPGR